MASGEVGSDGAPAALLVDAHVHIHECFECEPLLDSASLNFSRAKGDLRTDRALFGCLMLTESAGVDCFAALAEGRLETGRWQVRPTEEAVALAATCRDPLPLFVIAGRQIVTAERLELLALGTSGRWPDGMPLRELIPAVAETGALAVVPWGFGKWTGRRGRLITALLAEPLGVPLYVGDNGGRPRGSWRPRLLAVAEDHGKLVLPGSDPLPFPGEATKAGRFGFVAELELDRQRPFTSLHRWLEQQERSPRSYGELERVSTFLDRQMRIQLRGLGRRWG